MEYTYHLDGKGWLYMHAYSHIHTHTYLNLPIPLIKTHTKKTLAITETTHSKL